MQDIDSIGEDVKPHWLLVATKSSVTEFIGDSFLIGD